MKISKILTVVAAVFLVATLSGVAAAQDHATAQEVVAKVREAAAALSKTGDVKQFDEKQGPWVWKDTYVFVQDCDKGTVAANPVKPELVGQSLTMVKDAKTGKSIYPDPAIFCKEAKEKPSGFWNQYWWPKPGEKEPSRKVTFYLSAKGTSYVACAGIYDEKATVAALTKISSMK